MALQVSRRTLLGTVAGVGATGAIGYGGARVAAKRGTVVARHVGGKTTTDDGQQRIVDVFHEELSEDGVDRQFDPAFRSLFPDSSPITVSVAAHETLTDRLSDVTYWFGHRCPDTQCSTPQVSRREFNATRPGEEVQLLYHGARASIVPP
jgi:hypothetical protein